MRHVAWAFELLKAGGVRRGGQKPEWWNDTELKALSARVVRAAPDDEIANQMRAIVLCGLCGAWEPGPRSLAAAELKEAATHFEQAAALHPAPAVKTTFAGQAPWCRNQAAAGMSRSAVSAPQR